MYVENDLDLLLNQFRDLFKNYEVMATSKDYIEITKKVQTNGKPFVIYLSEMRFLLEMEKMTYAY